MEKDASANYIGLGPMILDEDYMVANQKEVVTGVIDRIHSAYQFLTQGSRSDTVAKQFFAPHHVISIVGNRGAGKTSILATAVERLQEYIPQALVLNVIHPDQLSSSFPVSAVIVHAIEQKLRHLAASNTDIRSRMEASSYLEFRPLAWAAQVPETYSVVSRESLNTNEWKDRLFDLFVSPVDLVSTFHTWLRRILTLSGSEVLVVPIDDADISVEKAEEIIETLRTYLAHPTIVTVLAVDIPTLERRLRNSRLAKLPPIPEYRGDKDNETGSAFLFGMSPFDFQSAEAQAEHEYVENLLAKVLPISARFYLSGLTELDKVHRPFMLPGRTRNRSIEDILRESDDASSENSGPKIAPIITANPEVLSPNVRRFANQFIMIADASQRYLKQLDQLTSEERQQLWDEYNTGLYSTVLAKLDLSSDSIVTSGLQVSPIQSPEQLLASRFHMDIMHAFLTMSDLAPFVDYAQRAYGIDITRFRTAHEFVNFVLVRGRISGSSDFKLSYAFNEKQLDSEMARGMVDVCIDWALASGAKLEYIIDLLSVEVERSVRPVPIPKRLAERLITKTFAQLDPNVSIIERAFEKGVGAQMIVPVGKDRLSPAFVTSANGLGRYVHSVLHQFSSARVVSNALEFVRAIDNTKAADLTRDDIRAALFRALGVLSIQAIYHLSFLQLELVFDGNRERDLTSRLFTYTGDAERAWIVVELRGVFESLTQMLERPDLELSRKLIAITYVADLPMRILLGCVSGEDVEEQRGRFLAAIKHLLDDLSRMRFITDRELGSLEVGSLSSTGPSGSELWKRLNEHFFSLTWERRWKALQSLINVVSTANLQPNWDGTSEPPALWLEWATKVLKPESQKRGKRAQESSTDGNPRQRPTVGVSRKSPEPDATS